MRTWSNRAECTSSPSAYYGARISWNGLGWSLRFTDGTVFQFTDFNTSGPHALLTAIQDRVGNTVRVIWDAAQIYITDIKSPNGRWMHLTYTTYANEGASNGTISQVQDDLGRVVTYGYNSPSGGNSGNLMSMTDANGGVTAYTYDTANNLQSITDPRHITDLRLN